MPKSLSKEEAGRIVRYGLGLVRLGLLTDEDHTILHTMVWVIRKPGEAECDPSYEDLQRLTRKCRNTIAQALTRFEGLGFMVRKARYLKVEWGRKKPDGRGRENLVMRRTTNLYTFTAHIRHGKASYPNASVRSTASSEMNKIVASVEANLGSVRPPMPAPGSLEQALTRLAEQGGFNMRGP